jgi:signal transduction histidine kinase
MTLRTRLILTIGGVALLLVLPALHAAHQLNRLRDIAADVGVTHGAAYLAMGRFQARLAQLDRLARAFVAIPDPQTALRRDSALVAARTHLAELRAAEYGGVTVGASQRLDSIEAGIRRIDALIAADNHDRATDELESILPLFTGADNMLQQIAAEIDRRSSQDLIEAGRISATALTTTLLALLTCLFVALLLGAWATQTMVRPIQQLRRATAAVAAGEFVVPADLPYDRDDELGDLSRSFRGMAEQLEALDRMKADFMSIATHELKTPINVVSGYAELMQEGVYGDTTADQQEALTSIQDQSRILTQLVNQLLDISRLEAGGLQLEIQELSVEDLFDRVRRTFDVLARQQDIDLEVDLDPAAPATIPADGDRLRDQVLGNLVANALKFTPSGGTISVRGRPLDGHMLIEVEDTGEGMPADQLPHVFDKYYQIGEQARSRGAGLGLTIAQEVVHAHGGDITVESEVGRGTTFRISLPVSRSAIPATAQEPEAASR